ncbi:DUF3572 family protein [Sandaracinobacteroides hominis]|uniref:DUF3572 family protein n=1 Tax=Sandaracinobacteroides hominis TaxID=2780086 RepID=UPI001A9C9740|nr:DUF3572 family protein [Sandaracinobacteroides hominis]
MCGLGCVQPEADLRFADGRAFSGVTLGAAPRYPAQVNDTLALQALAAVISDEAMRPRFLDLTGFDVPTLRARAGEADVLNAVIAFLSAHEPDLLRVAETLGVKPGELAGAMV